MNSLPHNPKVICFVIFHRALPLDVVLMTVKEKLRQGTSPPMPGNRGLPTTYPDDPHEVVVPTFEKLHAEFLEDEAIVR